MKLPSIKNLADGAVAVAQRFPFEVLFALTGCIAASTYTELSATNRLAESWCCRVILIANLGLLLSLATTLYTESKSSAPGRKLLLRIMAAAIGIALIFIIDPFAREADRTRFVLISLAFHLLVAFAGFTVKGHVQGFWQFNKALFLRFLTGLLYSMVLYAGIAAAIGAMNFLFNFKFEWDTFMNLWIWIAGMFNTLFFLAGVPADLPALDQDDSYPKGLKIFTQYVLIPLATLYVIILLAYEAKILVLWSLPKGLVSNLILGYAVFGILSILLVYPVRDREENKWIKTYARSFYFLMLPLIVLLLLAVGTRVFRYGITEWRYFLIVLAAWLLFITVYFLVSKKQNIKLIPISLCFLTLLTVYGPQSAFSVAMYSQRNVLIRIFKRNNAFKDGKLAPLGDHVSKKDGNRAVATLDYLIDHHDLTCLSPYLAPDAARISDSLGRQKGTWNNGFIVERYELRNNKLNWIKRYLHLNRFSGYDGVDVDSPEFVSNRMFRADNDLMKVQGYDYILSSERTQRDTIDLKSDHLHVTSENEDNISYKLTINGEILRFNIGKHADQLLQDEKALDKFKLNSDDTYTINYVLPADKMTINAESAHYSVSLCLHFVNCHLDGSHKVANIYNVNADYLIRLKR